MVNLDPIPLVLKHTGTGTHILITLYYMYLVYITTKNCNCKPPVWDDFHLRNQISYKTNTDLNQQSIIRINSEINSMRSPLPNNKQIVNQKIGVSYDSSKMATLDVMSFLKKLYAILQRTSLLPQWGGRNSNKRFNKNTLTFQSCCLGHETWCLLGGTRTY